MKRREVKAQQFTETARSLAMDRRLSFREAHEATRQRCGRCGKFRGIGYVVLDEHGEPVCIFCRDKRSKGERVVAKTSNRVKNQ